MRIVNIIVVVVFLYVCVYVSHVCVRVCSSTPALPMGAAQYFLVINRSVQKSSTLLLLRIRFNNIVRHVATSLL